MEATNRLNTNGSRTERDPILDGPEPARDSEAPEPPRNSAAVNAHQSRWRIPGDVIARTCKDLTEEQRHAINWAHSYCRSKNLSHEDLAKQLRKSPDSEETYSGDSVYQTFTGRRDNVAPLCQAIHVLRRRVEETCARAGVAFVETSLSKKIFAHCRRTFNRKAITFILGATRIGKTRTLEEYARQHNHGETKMIRLPSGGSIRVFLVECAIVLGISTQCKSFELRRRIFECFDERTLLIVDECEEGMVNQEILNFIRELWDRRKCGVVFSGAMNLRDAPRSSYNMKKLCERGIRPLILPSVPPAGDLDKFAEAFGLTPAPNVEKRFKFRDEDGVEESLKGNPQEIQNKVIRDHSLGRWLAILEDAADTAKESQSHISWNRVIVAYELFSKGGM